MSTNKKIEYQQIEASSAFVFTEAEPEFILSDEFGVGPQGYWIRSESGLKRMGYAPNPEAKNSFSTQWTQKDWEKHDIFQVTVGVQGTTGNTIRIVGVEDIGDTVRISIQHIYPDGMVGEALTHPSAMLATQKWPVGKILELWINGKKADCQWHIVD